MGYELYCRLLETAVRGLQKMPPTEPPPVNIDLPGEAWLPRDYVPDFRAKVDVYRRLSRATAGRQVDELAAELSNRFGLLPDKARRLLGFARLRCRAIDSITRHPDQTTAVLPLHADTLADPHKLLASVRSLLELG